VSDLHLQVNGEPRTIPGPATLLDLLGQLAIEPRMVAVELNRKIVRRPQLGEVSLKEGDQIELVHFVGGG
jgi:thiamine biosynthesis protein ThiS